MTISSRFLIVSLLLVSLAACAPSLEGGRYFAEDQTFSLVPPEGWQRKPYAALIGPSADGSNPNLVFGQEQVSLTLEEYVKANQDNIKLTFPNLKVNAEEFLTTDEGKNYFRWEFELAEGDVPMGYSQYVYESGEWKLIITYTHLMSTGSEFDDAVEEAMKSVWFER